MNKLDKKIKGYHFVVRTMGSLLFYVGLLVVILLPNHLFGALVVKSILIIALGILDLFLVIFNFILPFFIYRLYGYQIEENHVVIYKGVMFRRQLIVPIKRIQHLEKYQGPIQTLFHISSIIIFTAGSNVMIVGVPSDCVDSLIESIRQPLQHYLDSAEVIQDES